MSATPKTDALRGKFHPGDETALHFVLVAYETLELNEAALIAALTRYKAAVDGASFADEEMTPEFNREIMEASAQVAVTLAKVRP